MSGNAPAVVIWSMGITMGWISAGRRLVAPRRMDHAPRVGERLVRRTDGKPFEVAYVATLPGGNTRYTLRAGDGERASLECGELFPCLGKASPYELAD